MNATRLGKLLVFFTLVSSMVLATLALGVATNRIDWAGSVTPGESEGIHAQKRAEIEQMQDSLLRFRSRWKADQDALAVLEKKRPEDQKWYADQIKPLIDGNDTAGKAVANPIRNTQYEADGRLKVGPDGRPVLADNADARLQPLVKLKQELEAKEKEIAETITAIKALIDEEAKLSIQLRGDPGKIKGLNALLDEARLAQENSKKALLYAQQEAINGRVASASLLKRSKELDRRIAELKNHLREIAEANP